MTRPPTVLQHLEAIARELHELMRLSNPGCPAWEDLDPQNPRHVDIIHLARKAAHEFLPAASAPTASDTPGTSLSRAVNRGERLGRGGLVKVG